MTTKVTLQHAADPVNLFAPLGTVSDLRVKMHVLEESRHLTVLIGWLLVVSLSS